MSYEAAYKRLLQSMNGIASCATRCACCQMHNRIARQAITEAEALVRVPAGTQGDLPTVDALQRDPRLLDIPPFLRRCSCGKPNCPRDGTHCIFCGGRECTCE